MRVQTVRYKCCNRLFAACCEPDCYTDKDWLKSLRKYARMGHKIDLVEGRVRIEGKCECSQEKVNNQNQTSLFLKDQ